MVTGGCGFIASNFIHKLLDTGKYFVVNVDRLDYCSNVKNITHVYDADAKTLTIDPRPENYVFYQTDINNSAVIKEILQNFQIDVVYHFAAQTHVDLSFGSSSQFVTDNVLGTTNLLECCRQYGKLEKFIHVSTDEVYGDISTPEKEHNAITYGLYDPTNPYAATKAAAELMVKSYGHSYKLPIIITRSNNVYGRQQYWEKIIPKFIYLLMNGKKVPVYGDGSAKRKYLYIDDACDAYMRILEHGVIGETYEMGSDVEYTALEMAKILTNDAPECIEFVADRQFHDMRYIVNTKSLEQLGWKPSTSFEEGLKQTIKWYKQYAVPRQHWGGGLPRSTAVQPTAKWG